MEKKTILINGIPFTYDDELYDIGYDSNKPISPEDAINLLDKTKQLFDQVNLPFWLIYGTLLGAVRNHSIIPGDDDVDIYTDNETLLFNSIPYFYENGLKLARFSKGKLYSFRYKGESYIDVYILHPIKFSIWSLYCYDLESYAKPKSLFCGTEQVELMGKYYPCPKNPERFLEFQYGKDWMTPKQSKGHEEVLTRHIWKKCIIIVKTIIGTIIGYKYWKRNNNHR